MIGGEVKSNSGGRGRGGRGQDGCTVEMGGRGGGGRGRGQSGGGGDGKKKTGRLSDNDFGNGKKARSTHNNNSGAPSFGFHRVYKYLDMPPDKVVLFINEDLVGWKSLLDSAALKADFLVLAVTVLGEKVCAQESLHQQQVNILKECCLSTTFTKKLVTLTTELAMGSFPSWTAHQSGITPVDCNPTSVMKNLYQFCNFLFKSMPAVTRDNADVKVVIVMCHAAATGMLKNEEMEGKFTTLRDQLQELSTAKKKREENIRRQMKEGFTAEDERNFDQDIPPENIKDIPVIPSIQELRASAEIFLRPNKRSGQYNDSEHYCDVQFRLFREDFVGPLRTGVKSFLKNKTDYLRRRRIPPGELRLYTNVTFLRVAKENDCIVHKLQLAEHNYKRVKWAHSKRLLFGSLVILTTEKKSFEEGNTYFGIISSRQVPDLEKGIVTVTWEGRPPSYGEHREYLLFESEVYLESRKHTLETLKQLDLETFPLKKFIVEADSNVGTPQYLVGADKVIVVPLPGERLRHISLATPTEEWPTAEELGLDGNQVAAFQAALAKEFSIIQGPPGTGKTFIGLKIAECLLRNKNLWRNMDQTPNPITVVCYTNHALDQFLEGILDICQSKFGVDAGLSPDILRIGGSSRSDRMKEYTLHKMRHRKRHKRPNEYFRAETKAKAKVNDLEELRSKGMDQVLGLQNLQGIVDFERLSSWNEGHIKCPEVLLKQFRQFYWLGVHDAVLKRDNFQAEFWVRKWFRVSDHTTGAGPSSNGVLLQQPQDSEDLQDLEELYDEEELMEHRIMDDIFTEASTVENKNAESEYWVTNAYVHKLSVHSCLQERDRLLKAVPPENAKGKELAKFEKGRRDHIWVVEHRANVLDALFSLYRSQRLLLPDVTQLLAEIKAGPEGAVKLDELSMAQRWALYFAVVDEFRRHVGKGVAGVERQLSLAKKELQDVCEWGDSFIARDCLVVGLTTTGAAKYNKFLRQLQSKIVIVEEAAQVFEAQVVTCITASCEQLIMIGDHRQLQPNPNVYKLATRYNLNLSLFERMINNNLHCYPLKVQHRMRPDISELIRGTIYQELVDADTVSDPDLYPNVKGVTKNVFFITHSEPESSDEDSKSKSNLHEMEFMTQLCRYFVLQGYRQDQITVLATYKGQMFQLRAAIRNMASCKEICVSSVDDFQGQENDIILVSLVRSNEEGKVGFVKIDNRICVTLSRAKQGLFVIGNMTAMTGGSDKWQEIVAKLEAKGHFGEQLEVCCQSHGTKVKIQFGREFREKCPEGGCTALCNAKLPCTHVCKRVCHALDKEPEQHLCEEDCPKCCENKHPCKGRCHETPCPPCWTPVEKTLKCEGSHKEWMPCYRPVEEITCFAPVTKLLACGTHSEVLACIMSIYDYKCLIVIPVELPCGHPKKMKCSDDPILEKCRQPVADKLPDCGHEETDECWKWKNPEGISCTSMVPKKGDFCPHEMLVKCCNKDKPTPCDKKCPLRLPCGHECIKYCHGNEDPDHLKVKCRNYCARSCVSGHKCKSKHECWKPCPPCWTNKKDTLPCGHDMTLRCHQFTEGTYQCKQLCGRDLDCGHPCDKLCFEKCGPCKFLVSKTAPCTHEQEVFCSAPAQKANCMELIRPKNAPNCGHAGTLFPCKFEDATPEELANHCKVPCSHRFGLSMEDVDEKTECTHKCSGTCSECKQGRLHKKCEERCGRSLVCGHRCDVPCSRACPPCQKQCEIRCDHSIWKGKCGEPVPPCVMRCKWKCEHTQCGKLCGEKCDREPCREPCPEKLAKCGHDCIGFCGEPCPPLCRICNEEVLEEELELLAVEEDLSTARFVFLPDCPPNGHTIEEGALVKWLRTSGVEEDGRQEIGMKTCPVHSSAPLYSCRRFGNLLRQSYEDVVAVKAKAFGNVAVSRILRDALIKRFDSKDLAIQTVFSRLYKSMRALLVQEARSVKKPRMIDEYSMKSLDFVAKSAIKSAEELFRLKNEKKLTKKLYDEVTITYSRIFTQMMERHPLSRQEMMDYNQELDRADFLKQLEMRGSHPGINGKAQDTYVKAKAILQSIRPLTVTRKEAFISLVKQLDDMLSSGLGITDRERQDIVRAMGMSQGHWFKCPNGHIYAIGDCGGANQVGRCNVCRAPIGGMSYRLEQGNRMAGEMDGARAPAWPTMLQG